MGTAGRRGWRGAVGCHHPGQVKGHGPEPARRRKDPGPAAGQAMAGLPPFLRQHPSSAPPPPAPVARLSPHIPQCFSLLPMRGSIWPLSLRLGHKRKLGATFLPLPLRVPASSPLRQLPSCSHTLSGPWLSRHRLHARPERPHAHHPLMAPPCRPPHGLPRVSTSTANG